MILKGRYAYFLVIILLMVSISGNTSASGNFPLLQEPSFPPSDTSQAVPPTTTTGTTQSNKVSALGSVEAATVTTLTFQTSGSVKGVYVQLGDTIKVGEVLADLDDTDAWDTYNKAVLGLEKAQLSLASLNDPPTDEEIRTAKANVASAQAAYSEAANSTSSGDVEAANLSYQRALQNLQGLKDARAHMDGTDEEIALQEAKIGEASFNAEIAQLQLEDLQTPDSASLWQASARIQQQQLQLDKLMVGPTQAEIDSAQVAVQTAQASVEDAQTSLRHMQLAAPQGGTITAINISALDSVTQATAAIEISDFSHLRITVPINELDIVKVKAGANAQIKIGAISDLTLNGKVENIGWLSTTSSDGIVTYDVQVTFETQDDRVRVGMTGEVTIETESGS